MIRKIAVILMIGFAGWTPARAQLQQTAIDQINMFIREKQQRTPAQRKIESYLLLAIKMSRNEIPYASDMVQGVFSQAIGGRLPVDIRGTVDNGLLASIAFLSGTVVTSDAASGWVRAWLPYQN